MSGLFLKTMKKILILIIISICMSGFAADFSAKKGEWVFIPFEIPEGKIGGGDFYNIKAEPENYDYSNYEDRSEDGGIGVRFFAPGTFRVKVTVNHVKKSSCGGAESKVYNEKTFEIKVVN